MRIALSKIFLQKILLMPKHATKNPRLVFSLFILFFLNSPNLYVIAQTVSSTKLEGKIINSKDKQPVPYASITVKSNGKGTLTNNNGYFVLELPNDTASVIAASIGFKPRTIKITPSTDFRRFYAELDEDIHELDEVTVISEKERIVRVSENISSVKISPKMVSKLPNLGEVDVMRSFQLLPGISASNETSSGLYVRGGTPDQNLILFDGMTIYHVDHFYGFFSAFNANTIDDIELMKGGFPAKYGGRTSSTMVITGHLADLSKINAQADISLLSVNGALEVPLIKQRLSLQVAARRSYTDIIRTGLYNKIFDLYSDDTQSDQPSPPGGMGRLQMQEQQPDFYFYDLNSKLNFIVNHRHSLSVSFYNGKDHLDNSMDFSSGFNYGGTSSQNSSSSTDIAGWGNIGVSSQWKADWSSSFNSSLFVSYSRYFSNRDQSNTMSNSTGSESRNSGTLEDNNVNDVSFRLRNQWEINKYNLIEFGIENSYNKITYKLVFNDTSVMVNRNEEGNQTAVYVQDKVSLMDKKIEMNIGLRCTYQDIVQKVLYEPRTEISYEPVEGLKIRSAWGIYYQLCIRVVREDILQGSKDFWLLSDGDNIPVSSSMHYIAGISYEKGSFLVDAEVYYKTLNGLTEYSLRNTNSFRIASEQQEYFFQGNGYAKGIEVLFQKKYGLNTGWIGYTLSEVKYTYPDLNYGNPYYASHDQPHEFKAIYCRKIRRFDFSSTFIYATGKPYTSPESQYQLTLLDGSTYNYIHVSDKNSLRLPDYHRLDVAVSYNWSGEKTECTLSLSVFNVYNRKNVWYKKFEINEDEVTVTNVNYLGITPNLSFSIRLK
jgi:ferric enterobactin receptor